VHLYGYITKQQIFNNGNKRTALVFCNSLLISKAIGFINIPVNKKTIFSQKILEFYANKIDETQFINEVKQN
jgi:prophage maintenance system killer protein